MAREFYAGEKIERKDEEAIRWLYPAGEARREW
jgi:hypothetical protein